MTAVAKILLLDGNSLAYRAFFALPTDLATASGQVTNAVFGFTSMLINLLKDHQPDGIGVAFDRPEPTFRHELVAEYKAGRSEAPDILRQQMGLVRQVLEALKIPMIDAAGFEADDVIATLATQAKEKGDEVIVVTGDRDEYQLVEDPCVKVLYNRRGVSDYVLYDEAGIKDRTGVTPELYPQYAALRGDPSDNLPGVPGVGEKTAAKLINTYGDIDGVFANVDKNTPKLRENLKVAEEQVRQNAKATPLVRDVPLDVTLDDLRMGQWDADEVRNLFTFLEFRTLWDRLVEAVDVAAQVEPQATEALDVDLKRLATAEEAVASLQRLAGSDRPVAIGVSWDGTEGSSPLIAIAFAEGESPESAEWMGAALLADQKGAGALTTLVADGGPPLEAHRAKELMRVLEPHGVDVRSLDLDTAVAAYLVDPGESQYLLEELTVRYLGVELQSPDAAPAGQLDLDGAADKPSEDAGRRAVAVARLAPALRDAMAARNLFA